MSAATKVQGKGEGKVVLGDQIQTVTFTSPPTEGNLLVCLANVESLFEATMDASWTKLFQVAGLPFHGAVAAWIKTAGASEVSAVAVDYGEVNRRGGMIIYEYSHAEGPLSLDQYSTQFSDTNVNVITTETTPALSSSAVLAIAAVGIADDNANLAGTSWTNGFTGDLAAEQTFIDFFSALKDLDGTDVDLETTATFNGSAETCSHAVLVFRTPAARLASFREAVATDVASKDATASDVAGRDVGA